MSTSSNENSNGRRLLVAFLIVVSIASLGIAAGAYSYARRKASLPEEHVLEVYGLNRPVKNRLADRYQDADGDLVADAPADEAQWLDPDKIKFNYLATKQDHYAEVWTPFIAYLSEKIGRPVEYQPYDLPEDQLLAIHKGETQIVGVNSGSVPIAVNSCGFIPLCSLGSEAGVATYTMQIIVPRDSSITDVKQINGHMLTLTDSTSNSGWKAPMMVLWRDFQLQPVRNFDVVYSGSHVDSIRGIAEGKYQVAAVASDEVALAIARDEIGKDDFRVLYESEPFCNNVFGVPHNLSPGLAESIRSAFLAYPWEGTKLKEEFATIGADRFQPVDYKKNFKLIREIDDAMGRPHELSELSRKRGGPRG
ncbi:MAG: phosphate/phosphite/phosphonate ABC transporter substrate-binding protein [Pirellulales bacterium]